MSKTRRLTEIAICVAMALICSFFKIWEMPQGGSVSLAMIPILFISCKNGVVSGVITGMAYGLLAVLITGVIYHPASILLDYILAFGILGVSGAFGKGIKGIVIGSIIGVTGRFLLSSISGVVLFSSYAPQGQNLWLYSFAYQATYMIPELVICILLLVFLYNKARRLFGE